MPELKLIPLPTSARPLADLTADALVVGLAAGADGPRLVGTELLGADAAGWLSGLLDRLGLKGAVDEVVRIPAGTDLPVDIVVTTGLGEPPDAGSSDALSPDTQSCDTQPPDALSPAAQSPDAQWPDAETLRRAAGVAIRHLSGVAAVALALPAADAARIGAIGEGALLGAYSYTRYRTRPAPPDQIAIVNQLEPGPQLQAALDRATILARAVGLTRDLANQAPNDLYPQTLVEATLAACQGLDIAVTVLDEEALAEAGCGGILGVGRGSIHPPRLIRLDWRPPGTTAHIALAGKGITFDSGGLSIKPAAGMETMKYDMSGAATVLAVVVAAARLGLPLAVTGWMALAENMPGGGAQRPGDVVTIADGTTVEVTNTDAEGRLVLADALALAVREQPDAVVDIATLTGSQVVALGNRCGAVMGTPAVRQQLVAAAERSGEEFWPMPLPSYLSQGLESTVADLANVGPRPGGMLTAGLFLSRFTGTTPWAHLDVAGPAYNHGPAFGYTPKGGTGVGLRTLVAYLEDRAATEPK